MLGEKKLNFFRDEIGNIHSQIQEVMLLTLHSPWKGKAPDQVTKSPIRCLLHPNDSAYDNLPPSFLTHEVSEKTTCMIGYLQMSLVKGIESPKHFSII